MAGWLYQAARRGILTTRYPIDPPTEEEGPKAAHAPRAAPGGAPDLLRGKEVCPSGALGPEGIRQGACIRCARCTSAKLELAGPVDLVARTAQGLLWPAGAPSAASRDGEKATPLRGFPRSLHVFLVDVGSCNACNLESLSLMNPFYDSQRLGIFFTNSPRHADVLLVVGIPTEELVPALRRAHEAMPSPKAVVAVGACALEGGIFRGHAGTRGPLDGILPVDVYVPGCPPPPVAILRGLLEVLGRFPEKEGAPR